MAAACVARDGLSEREVGHLAFYELVLGSQSDAAVRASGICRPSRAMPWC
jgi:hypothetical protein